MATTMDVEPVAKEAGREFLRECAANAETGVSECVDDMLACLAEGCPDAFIAHTEFYLRIATANARDVDIPEETVGQWVDEVYEEFRVLPGPTHQAEDYLPLGSPCPRR